MKIGSDSVLLGAWTNAAQATHILDIGTGTGLLALMMAQRCPEALITGVEIDSSAARQAKENALRSPWSGRIVIETNDILQCTFPHPFDLIISNPPYFSVTPFIEQPNRATAREVSALPHEMLLQRVGQWLTPQGIFSLILPTTLSARFISQAQDAGLHLCRETRVCTREGKPPRRTMMAFQKNALPGPWRDTLTLLHANGEKTAAYRKLTEDFYL